MRPVWLRKWWKYIKLIGVFTSDGGNGERYRGILIGTGDA